MVVKEFGSVYKDEHVRKKAFNESLYKYLAIIIGIFVVAAFVWSNMPLANTVSKSMQTTTEVSTSDTSTGAATSSQANNAGQESLGTTEKVIQTDKWYSIGNSVVDKREITLKDYSTVVLITVEAKGLITATLLDTKLREQGKVLEVKVKVANSGNNKVLETWPSTIGQGGRTNVILGDWRELMNDKTSKIDSRTITWQPEFKVKNLPNQQSPTKDSI